MRLRLARAEPLASAHAAMVGIGDAAGIGLGGGFGGFGGAMEGNFAGDAVTLFADMKEQDMAQVGTSL